MRSVRLNGVRYELGDHVILNTRAPGHINAPAGTRVRLYTISSGKEQVGLYSPDGPIDGWSDLNGEVPNGRGWYVATDELSKLVGNNTNRVYEIKGSTTYRGKELKGKQCKVVANLYGDMVFVEMEEHVDGCSADGLGKTGHCVAIKNNNIKTVKVAKKQSN